MKKILFNCLLAFLFSNEISAQKKKVDIQYSQQDVYVVVNDILLGTNPSSVKVDFNLGGEIIFFKAGYYSQRVPFSPEKTITKLKVNLEEKPKNAVASKKRLLKPDTLLVSEIVTNMDNYDIKEVLDEKFIQNNYFIGKDAALFPQAVNEIVNTKYKIAIEIVHTNQIKAVYKSPKFMMAYAKIRWSLLNTATKKVVYFKETEGMYFVKIENTKGLQVSKQMTKVMKEAIGEAQFKLLTDSEFVKYMED